MPEGYEPNTGFPLVKDAGFKTVQGGGGAQANPVVASHILSEVENTVSAHTTAAVTPQSGSVLWMRVELSGTTTTLSSVTGTLTGTWNEMTDGADLPLGVTGGGYKQYLLWCSNFGTTGTIITNSSAACNHHVRVYQTTGVNTTTPFIAGQCRGSLDGSGPATTVGPISFATVPTHGTIAWLTSEQGTNEGPASAAFTEKSDSTLAGAHATAMYLSNATPGPQAFSATVGIFTQSHSYYHIELNHA